jgi:hypothetical protein
VAKDRAAPFSRKHRRYWLPVTGGMILIGAINVGLGLCAYEPPPPPPTKIPLTLPAATYRPSHGGSPAAPAPGIGSAAGAGSSAAPAAGDGAAPRPR